MNTIALIPARSGSKGVLDKNIKILNGFPLIAYSIAVAKMIKGVDRVIVSTDSTEYAKIARVYGAETPFLRPAVISNDKSTDFELFKHCLDWFDENEKYYPDNILHLRPTTPLRSPEIIYEAIHKISNTPAATSLRSGYKAPESPFKWFLKDENDFFKGIREDLTPSKVNLPRQSFPEVFVPDGYIDIIKAKTVYDTKELHGNKMLVFETPRTYEIDDEEDFNYIKYLIDSNGSPLTNYLKNL
jgi:N-acylneuraminate cytidylyltransferase